MAISPHVIGAWLMHHDQKLSGVKSVEFENIALAGRAARLLSFISKEAQWSVSHDRVNALAQANGIRRLEVAGLLAELVKIGVLDVSGTGISVLGVSQTNLFQHAAIVFEEQRPSGLERAALDLAEIASDAPVDEKNIAERLSDEHRLTRAEKEDLIVLSKQIGFVDHEAVVDKTLLFNGSLFRRENAEKSRIILDGLRSEERARLLQADELLSKSGCVPEEAVTFLLGETLWSKLHQIGFYQVSQVTNELGSARFVTKPSALVKYVPGGLADMHDDAKALASSLTYGILKSSTARGKISTPARLIEVLIGRGYVEGWAPAIIEDYVSVERRGVVQTSTSDAGYRLTLVKTEVGRMAQDLILKGDATYAATQADIGQAADFLGPEHARSAERLKDIPETKRAASHALDSLRKVR